MGAATPPVIDPRARSALRRLEWRLRRRAVQTPLAGEYRSMFRGRGMEFDQVVRYAYGDDIRDVDWNVTARLGELYRKVFVEERELTIIAVVADSPSLQFGSGPLTKREVLFDLAGLTLMLALLNRERAGLLHLTPTGEVLHGPSRRRARILSYLAALHGAEAPDPARAAPLQPQAVLPQTILPKGALIVWLGDPPDTPPPTAWTALRRRHPMVALRVEDPWEREGPQASGFNAYDPTRGELVWLEASAATRQAHAAWRQNQAQRWAEWWPDPRDRLAVCTTEDPLAALAGFLKGRAAQGAGR